MILVLGGCVLVTTIVLLILVGVGLRALLKGRDEVCVFSWCFPLEVFENVALAGKSVKRVRELPALLSTLRSPDTFYPIPDSGFFRLLPILYFRLSFLLLRRKLRQAHTRSAIRVGHYQTYGARMRARSTQQAA